MTRLCAYPPCEVEFEPSKPWQTFCSSDCRKAEWNRTHDRDGSMRPDASVDAAGAKNARRSGLQTSYPKTVEKVAADYQSGFGLTAEAARRRAEQVVGRALSARQQARRLEARER